jgi:peptide/nickel transport system substrate-binding protein
MEWSLTSFTPQLASSWTSSGNTLAIHLRPGVKWQDGKAVTSTDVYDTIVLDGTNATAGWLYIPDVSAPNPNEVVITTRAGTNAALLEDQLFTAAILPSSVYGQFVTPGLKADDVAYYAKEFTDPAAAQKMPQAINTAEALLVK